MGVIVRLLTLFSSLVGPLESNTPPGGFGIPARIKVREETAL